MTAIKLRTGILAITLGMMAGGALAVNAAAQNPDAIDNARSAAKSLQQKQADDTNAAGVTDNKPAPGAPAPAVKPAVIPGSKPAAASTVKAASASNQLQKVNVTPGSDGVQLEIISNNSVCWWNCRERSVPLRRITSLSAAMESRACALERTVRPRLPPAW